MLQTVELSLNVSNLATQLRKEGCLAAGQIFKEKEEPQLFNQKKGKEENIFSQNPEQPMFSKPAQPQWPPAPQPMMPKMQQPMPQPNSPMIPPPLPMPAMAYPSPSLDFGMDMPSMEPAQPPDLDFPEELAPEAESKKKGLFGMFKK